MTDGKPTEIARHRALMRWQGMTSSPMSGSKILQEGTESFGQVDAPSAPLGVETTHDRQRGRA